MRSQSWQGTWYDDQIPIAGRMEYRQAPREGRWWRGPPETAKPIRLEGAKLRLRYAEGRKWGPEAEEDKNEKTCKEIFYVKVKPVEPRDARQRHQIHTEAQAPAGEAPNEPGDQRRTQREKSVKGTDTPRPT